jgi:hypothetical protein
MWRIWRVLLVGVLCFLGGCKTIVVESSPPGAEVYHTVYHEDTNSTNRLVKLRRKTPCSFLTPSMSIIVMVKWPDGRRSRWQYINPWSVPTSPDGAIVRFDRDGATPEGSQGKVLEVTNTAVLRIDSEPSGARVYAEGRGPLGITPLAVTYVLAERHYGRGFLLSAPLVCAKDGFLPQKVKPKLQVVPQDCPDQLRPETGGRKVNFHQLFLLERDPHAPTQSGTQHIDVTTRQDDSPLDTAQKFGNLLLTIKALSPVR